ncbi:MAG TPA: hypothetical protein VGE31_02605 [Candidatus Paceibacterota bacterium]
MLEKLKSLLTNELVFQSLLLLLVAVSSFGLGRQSALSGGEGKNHENKPYIQVQAPVKTAIVNATTTTPENQASEKVSQAAAVITVVGSKSGTKYHLPDCPGAKRIKPENLLTFETIDAARAAGYTAAANCPGLE